MILLTYVSYNLISKNSNLEETFKRIRNPRNESCWVIVSEISASFYIQKSYLIKNKG